MSQSPDNLQQYVQLMTQHQGVLRAFIISLMPGSQDVEDVLQETNLILWKKRSHFEVGTKFLSWAFTIARYEVMKRRSLTKRDHRLVFSDELVATLAEDDDGILAEERLLSTLEGCLSKLSNSEKDLIEHRYSPGKSLKRLAKKSGKSASGLRIALFRVRAALRSCVDNNLKGETL